MRRSAWTKSWWGRGLLIATGLSLLVACGTLLFDCNNDGIDDGGLAMWIATGSPVPVPLAAGRLATPERPPTTLRLVSFCASPRSPPCSRLTA